MASSARERHPKTNRTPHWPESLRKTVLKDSLPKVDAPGEFQGVRRPIRVGLLVDEPPTARWINETVEQLLCDESVELALVVRSPRPRARWLQRRSLLFTLWTELDKWAFSEKHDPLTPELRTYRIETINLSLIDQMGRRTPSSGDLAQIQAHHLDLLVQLGSSDLPDGMLNCAKYGVWGFHYGAYSQAEAELALFWDLYDSCPTCELVLSSRNGDQRRDRVLYRGTFANDLTSLHRNLILDCRRRAQILLRCISDFSHQGWRIIASRNTDDLAAGRTDRTSIGRVMPQFIASWFRRSLRRLWARVGFREQWFVAYRRGNAAAHGRETVFDCFTVVKPRGLGNYADPFLFERNGKTYLFFEEYDERQPGIICCAEFQPDGTLGQPQRVLARSYHLSYPSVFEWRGQVYMLPETQNNKTIEVYGAVDFPHRWELAAVLLSKVSAVDPTIFEHNGKLWLFAAGLGGEGTESNELSLFFADSLFGKWCPHPMNPIVCDARRARPAGSLFFQRDLLIRPGQNCAAHYGHAISLNKVEELSETNYREVPFATILPDWMDGIFATHTLNQRGGITVLDARAHVPRFTLFKRTASIPS